MRSWLCSKCGLPHVLRDDAKNLQCYRCGGELERDERTPEEIEAELRETREQCGDCGAEILGAHGHCPGVPGGFGDEKS